MAAIFDDDKLINLFQGWHQFPGISQRNYSVIFTVENSYRCVYFLQEHPGRKLIMNNFIKRIKRSIAAKYRWHTVIRCFQDQSFTVTNRSQLRRNARSQRTSVDNDTVR